MTAPPWNPNPTGTDTSEGGPVPPFWRCFVALGPGGEIAGVWLGPYKRALPRLVEIDGTSRHLWRELKADPSRFTATADGALRLEVKETP